MPGWEHDEHEGRQVWATARHRPVLFALPLATAVAALPLSPRAPAAIAPPGQPVSIAISLGHLASPLRPQPSSSPPVFIGGRPPANATPSSQRPSQLAQRR
uniref:Uncharacterized protein n=1 Tax=Oryza barthii TaxID=65489 RepID=A0A0D3EZS5_9ORYZ